MQVGNGPNSEVFHVDWLTDSLLRSRNRVTDQSLQTLSAFGNKSHFLTVSFSMVFSSDDIDVFVFRDYVKNKLIEMSSYMLEFQLPVVQVLGVDIASSQLPSNVDFTLSPSQAPEFVPDPVTSEPSNKNDNPSPSARPVTAAPSDRTSASPSARPATAAPSNRRGDPSRKVSTFLYLVDPLSILKSTRICRFRQPSWEPSASSEIPTEGPVAVLTTALEPANIITEPETNEATNDLIDETNDVAVSTGGAENKQKADDSIITLTEKDGEDVVDETQTKDDYVPILGLDQESSTPPSPLLQGEVPCSMVLRYANELSGDAIQVWKSATSFIMNAEATKLSYSQLEDNALIQITLVEQTVLSTFHDGKKRSLQANISVSDDQAQTMAPLQLNFTVSTKQVVNDSDVVALIGDGFKSFHQRGQYLEQLRNLSRGFDDSLKSMDLFINDELIVAENAVLNAKSSNEHSNESWGIIVGVAAASLVVAIMVMLGGYAALHRHRKKKGYRKHDDESTNAYLVEDEAMKPVSSFDDGSYTDETTSKNTTYSIVAPAGKLGLEIRNSSQTSNIPVVDVVKETSALSGQVQVGDMLISVDEIDCKGLGAKKVTELICERSSSFARQFVFLRQLQAEEV